MSKQDVKNSLSHLLENYKDSIDDSSYSFFSCFNIEKGNEDIENLIKIILLDIQSRGGPKLNEEQVNKLINKFRENLDIKNKSVKDILKQLCEIKIKTTTKNCKERSVGIGAKIASVIMKNMVYYLELPKDRYDGLINDLYTPIDIWIRRILIINLRWFDLIPDKEMKFTINKKGVKLNKKEIIDDIKNHSKIERLGEDITDDVLNRILPMDANNKRFDEIQERFSELHKPRVQFDYFWFIGSMFCSRKSKFICDNCCWIKDFCKKRDKRLSDPNRQDI